jgi:hypothetical protein
MMAFRTTMGAAARGAALVAGLMMFSVYPVGSAVAGDDDLASMSCSELWYARNALFAQAGYCFKTDRAIAVFGKRCHPPYGELSGYEKRRVDEIKEWEARKGCSRD